MLNFIIILCASRISATRYNFHPANPHFMSCVFAYEHFAKSLHYSQRTRQPLETSKGIHYSTLPVMNLVSGSAQVYVSIPGLGASQSANAETSKLTYVKIKWIISSRTSCSFLRRGVSASSQMVLKRHCLPSRQPYLKSQHWILLCNQVFISPRPLSLSPRSCFFHINSTP